MEERERGGAFQSFQDFCQRMADADLNKRAVENLIRAGAFDGTGARRRQLMAVYERVLSSVSAARRSNLEGQMDFFAAAAGPAAAGRSQEAALPDLPEYTAAEKMAMERETTGLYLSGHPMNDYRAAARRAGAVPIGAVIQDFAREDGPAQFQDGQRITIAGIVSASKTRATRNNSMMAYVTVEDDTSSIELLCFSKALQQYGSYFQVNLPVVVRGRLSVRDEKSPQIMVDFAAPLTEDPAQQQMPEAGADSKRLAGETLFLRLPGAGGKEFRRLELLLQMFPGDTPVKVRLLDTGKLLGARCLLHASLVRELREYLGEENVVIR